MVVGTVLVAADEVSRWLAHVHHLAHDSLEGRETGSPGHRKAAEYVAEQFERAGLKPIGASGYMQAVRFQSRQIVEDQSSLALLRSGRTVPLALGDDAVFNMRVEAVPSVEAPLVFAGYGLAIPEVGHDDFAGLDVGRKIVVYLSGAPSGVPPALSAHDQSAGERWAAMKRAGAIGAISIQNPRSMDVPWNRSAPNRWRPALALIDSSLDDTYGQQLSVTFNPARADRLFEGLPYAFQQVLTLATAGKALPRFDLQASLRATVHVERRELESHKIPFRRLMVFGLRVSDLENDVNAVAESMNLGVQDDPEPLRNRFIRSDQYSFVKAGVPAVALKVGYDPDSPDAAVMAAWTKERYHAPSDDVSHGGAEARRNDF
jgi:hypothetical protein